jgi:hypothetical protein
MSFLSLLQKHFIPLLYSLGAVALTWLVQYDPFFWDTIQLASKHAHFFFENNLQWAPLPNEIDSGHPPFLGYYLAVCWHFFGQTLPVSHWAMLPFFLLNIWLLCSLGNRITDKKIRHFFPLLVFSDPVIFTQSSLVSPDLLVMTGFLLALEGWLSARKGYIALGVLLLCVVSMRGMMTAAALTLWSIWFNWEKAPTLKSTVRTIWPAVPGFALAAVFLMWHHLETGWTGYHKESPWGKAFEQAGLLGGLRNFVVLSWRFLDFGRAGEWLALIWLLAVNWKRTKGNWLKINKIQLQFGVLFLVLALLLLPSALIYQNLSAHRYFIPLFIALHLFVFSLLANSLHPKKLLFALALGLIAGNFWQYPQGISMDWDCTFNHRPYHRIREHALLFLQKHEIPFDSVGSAFPNLNTGDHLLLNGDLRRFVPLDLASNGFVFCSNVFNDINQDTYLELKRNWKLIWREQRGLVWVEIFERNK